MEFYNKLPRRHQKCDEIQYESKERHRRA